MSEKSIIRQCPKLILSLNNAHVFPFSEFINRLDFYEMAVDEALRKLLGHIHPEGESQKIEFILEAFKDAYISQNPEMVAETFNDTETIGVLAYSILMLHTSFYNKSVRRNSKPMTQQQFIHNNRGIDDGHDLPPQLLRDIYKRIAAEEFKTLPDHTARLSDVHGRFRGPQKTDNFLERHRRFVAWITAYDVDESSSTSNRPLKLSLKAPSRLRGVFIFNDVLVITRPLGRLRVDAVEELRGSSTSGAFPGDLARARRLQGSMGRIQGQNTEDPSIARSAYPSSATLMGTYSGAHLTSGQILRLEAVSGRLVGVCSTELPVHSPFHIEQAIPMETLQFRLFERERKLI